MPFSVIPAKAGIQSSYRITKNLDPVFQRGDDLLRIHPVWVVTFLPTMTLWLQPGPVFFWVSRVLLLDRPRAVSRSPPWPWRPWPWHGVPFVHRSLLRAFRNAGTWSHIWPHRPV